MNGTALSNCNAEDCINIEKDVQSGPDTTDFNALVQNFREAVKSLKELQEFAIQWNNSDVLIAISRAKLFVENQAAKRVNILQKTLLEFW
jgi:hypothetical protein